MSSISTLVVGAPTICREGLRNVLDSSRLCIVAEVVDAQDPVIRSAPQTLGLCVLTPGKAADDLAKTIRDLRELFPWAFFALIYDARSLRAPSELFEAGVHVCLPATLPVARLLNALELLATDQLIPPELPQTPCRSLIGQNVARGTFTEKVQPLAAAALRLSERETEILACIRNGESNKHIARRLVIAEATVKVHVRSLLRKLGVQNRTSAAVWALGSASSQPLRRMIANGEPTVHA